MNYLIWNYSLFGRFIHWNCAFSFATPHNVLGFQLKISSHLVIIKCFMCFLNFNYKITVVHCSTTETLQIFIYVHKKRMLSYWLKLWPIVTRLLLRRDLVLGPPPPPPLYTTTAWSRPQSFDPKVRNTGHFIILKVPLIRPSRYYDHDFMAKQWSH